jgi:toxin ParE1/3/4
VTYRLYRERLAEQDLFEQTVYLARERPEVALRFVEAVEQACARLAERPLLGTLRTCNSPRLTGVRMWPLPGAFRNYLIFYQFVHDEVRILRVLHGARDIPTLLETAGD